MPGNSSKVFSKHARIRARRSAVQALYQWLMTSEPISMIIKEFEIERGAELKKADKEYFREILIGMARHAGDIKEILGDILDRPLSELDPVEQAIVRLGVYELKYREELPWRVVVNESIELAKMFGAEQSHKYINGVLEKAAYQLRSVEISSV